MKKLFFAIALMMGFVAANAQATLQGSKPLDNISITLKGGAVSPFQHYAFFKSARGEFGIELRKQITPVFGLAVESNAYFSNKPYNATHTFVRFLNSSLLGTVNFTNWFGGYPGEPRSFEVVGLYGIGWGHLFGDPKSVMVPVDDIYYVKAPEYNQIVNRNNMTSKAAVDFVFNLGDEKAWQFYVEPSVTWGLNDVIVSSRKGTDLAVLGHQGLEYNINKMYVQLNAGFIYKFQNSNGTHNFTVARLRDQAEIDGLNAEINRLRDELAKKPREIVKEVEVVKEVAGKNIVREVKVEDLVFVTFAQGKSELTADARKALSSIQAGKHVQIVGTASPEGNPELNQRLSQARADAVAQYLLTRGVAVDEATGKGVQGTTSNRLAVVYVK